MKKNLLLGLKLIVSVGLMIFLMGRTDFDHLRQELRSLPLYALVIGGGVMMLQSLSSGLRWQWLLLRCGQQEVGLGWCVRASMIGSFFNQCLPSSIGGDAFRIILARGRGLGWQHATASVLAERASGLFCLILLAFALGGIACLLPVSGAAKSGTSLGLWGVCWIFLAGMATIIALAFIIRSGHYPAFLKHLFTLPIIAPTIDLICTIYERRAGIFLMTSLGIFNSGLNVLVIWGYSRLMGEQIPLILLFMPVLLAMLATLIPLSLAGWGLREGAMVGLLGLYDIAPATALTLSVAFGLTCLIAALPGALLWLWPQRKKTTPTMAPS